MGDSKSSDQWPHFVVRQAIPADLEPFLELARECVAESGAALNEVAARYTFAGIARCEPAIHVLLAGEDLVGFSIIKTRSCSLTGQFTVYQDKLFVRAEVRNAETEGLLHALSHAAVQAVGPAEAFLFVAASEHAQHVFSKLIAAGYEMTGVQMAFRGDLAALKAAEPVVDLPSPVVH